MILKEFKYKGFRVTKHSYFGWGYYDEENQEWHNNWNYPDLKIHLDETIKEWVQSLPAETHDKLYHTKKQKKMKTIVQILIILVTVTGFGQAIVLSNNTDIVTIENADGESIKFKKILEVDTTKFNKEHFQNEVNGKKLTSIVIGRKKGLGMKTKSNYGLNYDQQLMIYNNGEEVYFLTPSMIYKRPTLTREKKDVIEKSKKSQLAIK